MLVASIVNLFKTNKTDKENSLKQHFCFDALFVCDLDLPDNGLVTNVFTHAIVPEEEYKGKRLM